MKLITHIHIFLLSAWKKEKRTKEHKNKRKKVILLYFSLDLKTCSWSWRHSLKWLWLHMLLSPSPTCTCLTYYYLHMKNLCSMNQFYRVCEHYTAIAIDGESSEDYLLVHKFENSKSKHNFEFRFLSKTSLHQSHALFSCPPWWRWASCRCLWTRCQNFPLV